MTEDELNDLLALCKPEETGGTTGEYAVWVNVRGC